MLLAQILFNALKTNKPQITSSSMFSAILTHLSNIKPKIFKGIVIQTCVVSEHPVNKNRRILSPANLFVVPQGQRKSELCKLIPVTDIKE